MKLALRGNNWAATALAGDVLRDRDPDSIRLRYGVGAHAVARDAAGGVGGPVKKARSAADFEPARTKDREAGDEMEIWEECRMEVVYCDDTPPEYYPRCEVRFDEAGGIVVTYRDQDGPVEYRGKDLGVGHFELRSADRQGHATLHRSPNSRILEGYWQEGGYRGFSRIELGRPR
jgi:hypothetical protein